MKPLARSLAIGALLAVAALRAAAHPADFLVTSDPQGIVVDKVNRHGIEPVAGSPFVPSPVPGTVTPLCLSNPTPQPSLLSLDREGKYLYALYATDGCLSIYSFQMQDGTPYVVSPLGYFIGAHGHSGANATSLVVGRRFVYVLLQPNLELDSPTGIAIFRTREGVLAYEGVQYVTSASALGFPTNPISLQVDEAERFLYLTYQGTIGTFGNCTAGTCVAIISIGGPSEVLSLIATVPAEGSFQLTSH